MPIEVRHAPSAGMAALAGLLGGRGRAAVSELEARRISGRLAAQLDARQVAQTQQLSAQRNAQMRQIAAQADRQREAADTAYARTALAAGLDEKIREQEFDREMTGKQEEARLRANQFEYQFTTKQRHEIAKLNEADQFIASSPDFSEEEKLQYRRLSAQKRAGIEPGLIPADPNKMQFAEGRELGKVWKDDAGSWMTSLPDGTPKLILRYDQTEEHHAQLREQEMALEQIKQAAEMRKEKAKIRIELLTEDTDTVKPGFQRLSSPEVDAIMRELYPPQVPEVQPAPSPSPLEPTWRSMMPKTPEQKLRLKQAWEIIRSTKEKYPDVSNIPQSVLRRLIAAGKIIDQDQVR